MRFTSVSSRAMWQTRWERIYERGDEAVLGPKGRAYILARYGEKIQLDEPDYDNFGDYDLEGEY